MNTPITTLTPEFASFDPASQRHALGTFVECSARTDGYAPPLRLGRERDPSAESSLLKRTLGLGFLAAAACGSTGAQATSPAPQTITPTYEGCHAASIEPDLKLTPTQVAEANTPPAGDVWITTTYLALTTDPAGQASFRSLMTELIRVLPSTPGLITFRFATSESCLSARTLAVWKDEETLEKFVRSPAHYAAMRQTNSLSRGSSTFTRWQGPIEAAEWARAAEELRKQDGPYQ